MSSYSLRLSSMLTFDKEREADIIKTIEELNNNHKTGQFLSNLIRLAFDNPDIIDRCNDKAVKGALLKQLESSKLTHYRTQFVQSTTKDVQELKEKVDKIYEMALKTYILGLSGSKLGLEEKSENLLLSEFILEQQIASLQEALGITSLNTIFASNKKEETRALAESVLTYIIESYSNIVAQLKAMQFQAIAVTPQQIQQTQQLNTEVIHQEMTDTQHTEAVQNEVSKTTVETEEVQEGMNGPIQFEGDLDLLSNFFND